MSAPANLERIAALDLDKRVLEALLARAYADGHPKIIGRLLQRLAENAHATGEAWGTKPTDKRRGERRTRDRRRT